MTNGFDLIVSNPPYIAESEKLGMESAVLDYEPHSALFVPDSDPLLFYRHIADFGRQYLKKGGKLYFEINPLFSSEMTEMLEEKRYSDISTGIDLSGKKRIIYANL